VIRVQKTEIVVGRSNDIFGNVILQSVCLMLNKFHTLALPVDPESVTHERYLVVAIMSGVADVAGGPIWIEYGLI